MRSNEFHLQFHLRISSSPTVRKGPKSQGIIVAKKGTKWYSSVPVDHFFCFMGHVHRHCHDDIVYGVNQSHFDSSATDPLL